MSPRPAARARLVLVRPAATVPAPEAGRRHLVVVPPLAHDHTWSLREVEYEDSGTGLHRFECRCGDVSYR